MLKGMQGVLNNSTVFYKSQQVPTSHVDQSTPIMRLSPELLSIIFLELRDSAIREVKDGNRAEVSPHYFGKKSWIRVTHVCHEWRAVALALPKLWSMITLNPQDHEWAMEMLTRSGTYPATVYVDLSVDRRTDQRVADVLAVLNTCIKADISRLKELRLRRLLLEDIHNFFDHQLSAPQLESFRIACYPQKPLSNARSFILSDQHLYAASLKRLSIICCQVDWDSSFFSHLTHLRLGSLPDDHRVSLPRFLGVLSRTPQLEILYLRETFEDDLDQTGMEAFKQDKVDLPFLRDIQLAFDMDYMVAFLFSIKIPRSSMFRFHTVWARRTDELCDTYYPIIEFLSEFYSSQASDDIPNHQPIRTIRIVKSNFVGFRFQAFYEVLSHEQMNVKNLHPPIDFQFGWEDWPSEGLDAFDLESDGLQRFLQSMPLQEIAVLEISGHLTINYNLWAAIFGQIPTLRSILLNTKSEGLLAALATEAILASKVQLPPDFAALKTLIIQDPGINVYSLMEAMSLRRQVGFPVEDLALSAVPVLRLIDHKQIPALVDNFRFLDEDFNIWCSTNSVELDSDSDDDVELIST